MNQKQMLAIKPETLTLFERPIGFDGVQTGSLNSDVR